MKDDVFLELAIALFVLLLFFSNIHVSLFSTVMTFGLIVSGFLVLRGLLEFAVGKGTDHLLMGTALYFMLIILF